jgi:DNA-nicking Smr family endonuclease
VTGLQYNVRVKKRAGKDDASGAEAFEREMADVVRLQPDPRGRVRATPVISPLHQPAAPADRRSDAGESEEAFAAAGVDRREIRKLKRGEHVAAERLDLHGLTAAEACAAVKQFLVRSRQRQHRCVSIVHGRGLHSEGGVSILKARVRECLRAQPAVLAYADAPRSDGGSGAVCVLLRK